MQSVQAYQPNKLPLRGWLAGHPVALTDSPARLRQVWLQLEAAAPARLQRVRRLLRRAGDAPSLIDADTEDALNGAAA